MRISEYGDLKDAPRSVESILTRKSSARGIKYRLVHRTAGWECAGSMARLREREGWGVLFTLDGDRHGRWFHTEQEARDMLDKWTMRPAAVNPSEGRERRR